MDSNYARFLVAIIGAFVKELRKFRTAKTEGEFLKDEAKRSECCPILRT